MALGAYVLKRILLIIPLFFISSILIFSLIHLAPGDPVEIMFRGSTIPLDPAIIEKIRHELLLDRPIHIQYIHWISNFIKGELGYSYINYRSVSDIIKGKIWATAEISLASLSIGLCFAVIFGVIAAVRQYSWIDNLLSLFSILGYSIPNFWMGLILILLFGLNLGWFPIFGMSTHFITDQELGLSYRIIDHLHHLILPTIVISSGYMCFLFRLVRSSVLDVLAQDYIITARAKGVSEFVVIYKHALRNALLPVVTVVGISIGFIFGGSVIVEKVFAWPGMGKLAIDASLGRDYPTLLSVSMLMVIMILVANLITDIAYAFLDPRIKY